MGTGTGIGIGAGAAVAVIILIFVVMNGSEQVAELVEETPPPKKLTTQELQNQAVSWYYDDLLRNPERYKGEIIFFRGEIFRVDSLGKDHYAFIVWNEGELDQLVVTWKGNMLLDGDEISGYGKYVGVVDMGSMLVENYYNPKPHIEAIQLTCYNC